MPTAALGERLGLDGIDPECTLGKVAIDMAPVAKTCILIPTFPSQLAAAQVTTRWLARYWPGHPPAFLCGIEGGELPLADPPVDWMAIVHRAVSTLVARGFDRAFLILDDQGPLAPCHARHLEETIPAWMSELGAIYISLRGWDHRRNARGVSLGPSYLGLQRQAADFRWRFALHPALWRLDALAAILQALRVDSTPPQRSAWQFEIRSHELGDRVPLAWHHGTYRVCGRSMSLTPLPPGQRLLRDVVDGAIRFLDTRAREHPRSLRGRLAARIVGDNPTFFDGSYPLHHSGFLVRGRINAHLLRYLLHAGRHDLVAELREAWPGTVRSSD